LFSIGFGGRIVVGDGFGISDIFPDLFKIALADCLCDPG